MSEPVAMEFQVAKLDLAQGDVLVIKTPYRISDAQRQAISAIRANLPFNNLVLVLDPNMDIEVIKKAALADAKETI